jgi:hypothetical protein
MSPESKAAATQEEDEFSSAFEESLGRGGSEEEPTEGKDEADRAEEEPISEEGGEEEPPGEEPAEEGDGDQEEKPEEEDEPTEEEPSEKESAGSGKDEVAELKKELEETQHKYSTLSGMYNSLVKKVPGEEGEQEKPESDKEPKEDPAKASMVDVIKELDSVKQFSDEFGPELSKAFEDIGLVMDGHIEDIQKAHKQEIEDIKGTLDPLYSDFTETSAREHFAALEEAHPDFREIRDGGELQAWIDKQPDYKRRAYEEVYENGAADEVIDLFSDFKAATGYRQEEPPGGEEEKKKKKVNTEELEEMDAVTARKPPVSPAKGRISKDDFEAAWREANQK